MSDVWLALPTGIGIATVASAVGIGGGILWMPFLMIMMRLQPETAVLSSLIIQSAGMGSGTAAYGRLKRIDYRLLRDPHYQPGLFGADPGTVDPDHGLSFCFIQPALPR